MGEAGDRHISGTSTQVPGGRRHYAWVVVLAAMASVFVSIGLARFALGMLLPSMGQGLDLGYAEMGFISTANFLGYLLAMLLVGPLVSRWGERRVVVAGLAVIGLTMALVAAMSSFSGVLLPYAATGVASGLANVTAMTLVTHWFTRRRRGRAAGLIVMGSGFAIIFSGSLVPWVNAQVGIEGWRVSWACLGALSLAIAGLCALLLRDRPEDLGLTPYGPKAGAARARGPAPKLAPAGRWRILAHLGAIYFGFGSTYVIYLTFVVTTLVDDYGLSEAAAGSFWIWLGTLSLVSGPLFGGLSDRIGRKAGLMLVFAIQMSAYLFMASGLGAAYLYASIGLFGISAWAVPTIVIAAVGDYLGPERAASALGAVTLIFALGQVVGPSLGGLLAEWQGNFTLSYLLAASLAAGAILVTAFLRRPEPE